MLEIEFLLLVVEVLALDASGYIPNIRHRGDFGIFHRTVHEALCRELKARGHKLYVVTNGTAHIQHRRFGASGLEAYMDGVFISEEMGTQKPAPEFFEKVFAALEWPDKENCIILGDSQSSDMLGGKNAGITTCWYNPKGEIKKGDWAFEIRSLEQFLEVVS